MPLPTLQEVEASLTASERVRYNALKKGVQLGSAVSGPAIIGIAYAFYRVGQELLKLQMESPVAQALVHKVGAFMGRPGLPITAATILGFGYLGCLVFGGAMETPAAMNLMARTRDFHLDPMTARESFWRGLKAGTTKGSPITKAGIGMCAALYFGIELTKEGVKALRGKNNTQKPEGPG